MSTPHRAEPAPIEAAAVPAAKAAQAAAVLRGDEIIELSLRPSHWMILIQSFRVLVAMTLLATALAVSARHGWTWWALLGFQACLAVAALRIFLATLQWASRLYVLTNRRVMRFQGIFTVELRECPLARISAADLSATWYEALLRLGSVRMKPDTDRHQVVTWKHINRPREIHERLLRAIRQSQSGQP
jgi:uncharacterized membrane protein YdbT with pleckstrin-like domain